MDLRKVQKSWVTHSLLYHRLKKFRNNGIEREAKFLEGEQVPWYCNSCPHNCWLLPCLHIVLDRPADREEARIEPVAAPRKPRLP